MSSSIATVRSVVAELEALQEQIGKSQLDLLNLLTDDSQDEWDCAAQTSLLKLEIVQRTIGETQILLVETIPLCDPNLAYSVEPETTGHKRPPVPVVTATESPGPSPTPEQWLNRRGIKVKATAPPSGLDASADRAALLLGEKFSALEPFYMAIRRRVAQGSTSRWFKTGGLSREVLNEICDFGNRVKASGFFSEFQFFSRGPSHDPERKPAILFDPVRDPRVKYFFEGGWLERYAFQVVRQGVQKRTGTWCEQQFAKGVRVEFPNGEKGELDTLVSLPGDKLLWLECKTGRWQDYIERFRFLNRKFLKIPREQTALVLVHQLDAEEKASASELTDMTVIHFSDLTTWLNSALT